MVAKICGKAAKVVHPPGSQKNRQRSMVFAELDAMALLFSLRCSRPATVGPLTKLEAREVTSDGKTSVLTQAEYPAASELIGRSLAGTPQHDPEWTVDWTIGPQLKRENVELRSSLTECYLSFVVSEHTRSGGVVLAAKDADGKLQAVCVCRKMSSGKMASPLWQGWVFSTHAISRMAKGKLPPFYMSKDAPLRKTAEKSIDRRSECVFKAMEQLHEQETRPHWYIAVMAVEPLAQGQGYGGQLVRAVSRMAAADGVHCYVEASGTRNKAFYEHLGFEVLEQKRLTVYETVDIEWPGQAHFYSMVRAPHVKENVGRKRRAWGRRVAAHGRGSQSPCAPPPSPLRHSVLSARTPPPPPSPLGQCTAAWSDRAC